MSETVRPDTTPPSFPRRYAGFGSFWDGCSARCPLTPLNSQGITLHAERDDEIVGQGEEAAYCYLVLRGCIRTVRLMVDGRRHIGEFLLPGELFGWEDRIAHNFAAEAVSPAALRRYPRQGFDRLAECDHELGGRLRDLSVSKLCASRERVFLLGRMTAAERTASFLLEMAARLGPLGGGPIALPMSRADIADYLGLTIETVCRTLTQLRREGIIAVERAVITISDHHALRLIACEPVH